MLNHFQLNKHWRFLDHSTVERNNDDPLKSFAFDDTLCQSVGSGNSLPTIRTWVHSNVIVLGIQDSRLPYLNRGLKYLHSRGYKTIVRNSGGLAVVLDSGILNISLLLKESTVFSINSGYEAMFHLVKKMFDDFGVRIEAKEIVGSYCPGSYDLSIHDKKFAGISQRRVRGGVAVQIYLCVDGTGSERAELIKSFYQESIGTVMTKFEYPTIVPATMASLGELLSDRLSVHDVMRRLLSAIMIEGGSIFPSQLTNEETPIFEKNYQRMLVRNEGVY